MMNKLDLNSIQQEQLDAKITGKTFTQLSENQWGWNERSGEKSLADIQKQQEEEMSILLARELAREEMELVRQIEEAEAKSKLSKSKSSKSKSSKSKSKSRKNQKKNNIGRKDNKDNKDNIENGKEKVHKGKRKKSKSKSKDKTKTKPKPKTSMIKNETNTKAITC